MISGEIILARYRKAEAFLLAREAGYDWETEYQLYRDGELSDPRTMALLTPESYGENPGDLLSQIRGRRAFSQLREHQKCQAALLWGYDCTLRQTQFMSADHIFPFSLGGISEGPNLLWLCTTHNRIKGSDIHVFPWERGIPHWVGDVLARIAPIASRLGIAEQR